MSLLMSSGVEAGPMGLFGYKKHLVRCTGGYPSCHKWKFSNCKFCVACRQAFLSRPRPLSEHQEVIIALYGKGLTIKEIAYELGLSPKTIEFHIAQIRKKLNISSSIFLAPYALQHNLIKNHFSA